MRLGKRGISPLVATILLLAFAVAIGTMVVAYLLDTFQARPCDDVAVVLDSEGPACYANGQASFILTNAGDRTVTGMVLRLTSTSGDIQERRLTDELLPAGAVKIDFPFSTIDPTQVKLVITPWIIHKGSERYCTDSQTTVPLRYC